MSLESPTIPSEVSLVDNAEQGSPEQLRNLVAAFAAEGAGITVSQFRAGWVTIKMHEDNWTGQDTVLANLAYIEGRRTRPLLPPGVSDETFISMIFNA
jgi:hypothetical protein